MSSPDDLGRREFRNWPARLRGPRARFEHLPHIRIEHDLTDAEKARYEDLRVLHSLEASRLAAFCLPERDKLNKSRQTRELDHMLAAVFGFWDLVLPASKRFKR